MGIIDDLIGTQGEDCAVRGIHCCVFWTAVLSRYCGLASTFHEEHPGHGIVADAGSLILKSALELAQLAGSGNVLEASIGMAAINSLLDVDESRCVERNAFEILCEKGRDRNVAVVGHFPWVSRLAEVTRRLWVIEQRPREGDLPAGEAESILPRAEVVGITGTTLINHTVERLLELSRKSFVVMLGPTTPLSPVLFDYGVDVVAGTRVVGTAEAIRCIGQGAVFSQIEGIRLLTMEKDRGR